MNYYKRPKCGRCRSRNTYGVGRVVGYYSQIDNWNEGKVAEHKDRRRGRYKVY